MTPGESAEEEAFRKKHEEAYDSLVGKLAKRIGELLKELKEEGQENGPSIEDEFTGGKKDKGKP